MNSLTQFKQHLSESGYMPQSIAGYMATLRKIEEDVRGLLGTERVVTSRLTKWRTGMQTRLDRGEIKPATIRAGVTALRKYYEVMLKLGLYSGANPATALAYPRKRSQEYLPRPMTRGQLQLMIAALPDGQDRVLVELMVHGLRRVELTRLTWDDVVDDGANVTLRVQGKGGHMRSVPLQDETAKRLMALKSTGPVFTKESGRACGVRDINRTFAKYRAKAGLPARIGAASVGPHALRHTCATELLRSGKNIRVVQEIMGHRDIRTTTLYTQVNHDERVQAVNSLPLG